ncbi:hypothetical protein FGO68_gene4256 [Halteria grandinella]|uniref:Uncharacterized protein n=1 Tax=Halteria grandinella TaxID=5974 RepID=A0A8J8TAF1_HALGN|nr:hypothetical protein FGO68_gene4256 [Halteria grandinella]
MQKKLRKKLISMLAHPILRKSLWVMMCKRINLYANAASKLSKMPNRSQILNNFVQQMNDMKVGIVINQRKHLIQNQIQKRKRYADVIESQTLANISRINHSFNQLQDYLTLKKYEIINQIWDKERNDIDENEISIEELEKQQVLLRNYLKRNNEQSNKFEPDKLNKNKFALLEDFISQQLMIAKKVQKIQNGEELEHRIKLSLSFYTVSK